MESFRSKDARTFYYVLYSRHDQGKVFVDGCKGKFSLVYYELARRAFPLHRNMQDLEFKKAATVIDLVRRATMCVGTWPEKKLLNEIIFSLAVVYLIIHCILTLIGIGLNIRDITYVVACGMENAFNVVALFKIIICKIKRKSLARFIDEMRTDFVSENYKTNEEKVAFLTYNNFSRKFTTATVISGFLASSSYYFMSLAVNVEMVIANSSYGYKLPYKVWLMFEPTDVVTYACLCFYQFFFVPCLVFGYVGTDCLFVSLVLHVSGLFSALSCQVKHILHEPHNRQRRMKKLIVKHVRLIRLSESLEDDFNLIIFIQLIGSTLQFCFLGYDALVSSSDGEGKLLLSFCLIVSCILGILFIYCYIGECLISESSFLGDCFYQCEWYNISRVELKIMHICMMRSTKQMKLTSGKFCILSLNTFSDVLKTSMAYLSVLRTFM